MSFKLAGMGLAAALVAILSCNENSKNSKKNIMADSSNNKKGIVEEPVSYKVNGKTYDGYVTYDSNQTGKRPAILVVHEWWGLTDYPRHRAKQLAGLGYIAMAVDMYGDGKIAEDPKTAQDWRHLIIKIRCLLKQCLMRLLRN